MTIVGYRGKLDIGKLAKIFAKHLNLSVDAAKKKAQEVEAGATMKLEANFLLEEDLRDMDILLTH